MQKTGTVFIIFVVFLFFSFFAYIGYEYNLPYVGSALRYVAGPFFAERITPEQILASYKTENNKIKILIVPGHNNDSFGAQFRGKKEAQMNAELGQELFEFFQKDDKFETYATRVKNGDYSQWFRDYFESNKYEVEKFREDSRRQMSQAIEQGMPGNDNQVYHNSAADDDSLKLYAVNKWANENNVEIVFHIHFNDYPGRKNNQLGEYSGFSIYVPEYQLPNHRASSELAVSLKNQLEKYFAKSDLPAESSALIEDQELIAVGSNASRNGISVLAEYGYIYEPPFRNEETQKAIFKELAYQTYLGIKKFFGDVILPPSGYETTLLPHEWNIPLKKGLKESEDVLRFQAALRQEGLYPPADKTFDDCPINGNFGNCVFESVKYFQEKYADEILAEDGKVEKASGFAGPKTLAKLNELYGE
ncbi:MAG: hypothetical protein UW04_C0008G0002 [Parcubacteria group bacterium GW2011_GWB1_43_8]|nr:MAG: hypothetical protein UW04_C0008G0002 [Parcubacteria group bacterium GW2011_GWB1_43_8]